MRCNSILAGLLLAVVMGMTGCGGGGSDGGGVAAATPSNDIFKNIADNVVTGGSRSVTVRTTDSSQSGGSTGCGYFDGFYNRATVESTILGMGGSITSSTSTEFCASVGGNSQCFKQYKNVFIDDDRTSQYPYITIYMTGLFVIFQNHSPT